MSWFNIDKSERICGLYDGVSIEYEDDVLFICLSYKAIRLDYSIDVDNLYS